MIKVYVSKQSTYPVSAFEIKKFLQIFFEKEGIVSDAEVSVVFVNEKKMLKLTRTFLKEGTLHSVLTFNTTETKGEFFYPPGEVIHLGEIVVCYPKVVEEAKRENKLIKQKVFELVEHGARHLMGENHGE